MTSSLPSPDGRMRLQAMNATDWKTHIVRLVVSLPEQIYPIVPKQKRDASGADAQPCAPQKQEAQANWPGSTLIMMLRMQ